MMISKYKFYLRKNFALLLFCSLTRENKKRERFNPCLAGKINLRRQYIVLTLSINKFFCFITTFETFFKTPILNINGESYGLVHFANSIRRKGVIRLPNVSHIDNVSISKQNILLLFLIIFFSFGRESQKCKASE